MLDFKYDTAYTMLRVWRDGQPNEKNEPFILLIGNSVCSSLQLLEKHRWRTLSWQKTRLCFGAGGILLVIKYRVQNCILLTLQCVLEPHMRFAAVCNEIKLTKKRKRWKRTDRKPRKRVTCTSVLLCICAVRGVSPVNPALMAGLRGEQYGRFKRLLCK